MRKKLLLWTFLITLPIFSILNANMLGVTAAAETNDIAILKVTPSQTLVKTGELVNITVVVKNQGTMNETNFHVTVYYYYDPKTPIKIENKTVPILDAGASTSLIFTWNTTDVKEEIYATTVKEKTYTIKAIASTVPGETDIADNTLVSPSKVRVISQYITVLPQSTVDLTLTPGKSYTVSICTDYNGSDIWGYEFTLSYNYLVLKGISVTNGDLIVNGTMPGGNTGARFLPGDFNNTVGKLSRTTAYFDYFLPPPNVTSGPGILANITFQVVGEGESDIKLGTSYLEGISKLKGYDEDKGGIYTIIDDIFPKTNHILHGYFRNVEVVEHDVAVLSVTPLPTNVTAGEEVNITVTVKNNGTVLENFEVSVWYGEVWEIDTKLVEALEAGANKSLTFTWDTTEVPAETYKIKAEADPKHKISESNEDNNIRYSSESVTVKAPPRGLLVLPIELIIGIVVVVAVAAIAIYAVRRRKKRAP